MYFTGDLLDRTIDETSSLQTSENLNETVEVTTKVNTKGSFDSLTITKIPCRDTLKTSTSNDSGYEVSGKTCKALHCYTRTSDSGFRDERLRRQDSNSSIPSMQQFSSNVRCTARSSYNHKLVHYTCGVDKLSGYRKIGQGSYGIVYDALYNGQPCVVKARKEKYSKKAFLREIYIHESLQHPNIVQCMGVHCHGNKLLLLVMEKMWLNLSKYLILNPLASLDDKIKILTDVTSGLNYLHSQNIIHCDLTANNILLSASLQAKIGDFGMANKIGEYKVRLPGNFSHMPPEARIHNPDYNEKLDIFSLGCVMIHTITQEFPAVDLTPCFKGTEADKRSKYLEKIKGLPHIHSVIMDCLQNDPSCRPSANLLHHLLKSITSHHTLCKNKIYNIKVFYSLIGNNSAEEILNKASSLSFFNHVHVVHFLNKTTMIEYQWVSLSVEVKNNPSIFDKLAHIIEELASEFYIFQYDVTVDDLMFSICVKVQANIGKSTILVTFKRQFHYFCVLQLLPIILIIKLNNKSLLHKGKLVYLLWHNLSQKHGLIMKALRKNIGEKILKVKHSLVECIHDSTKVIELGDYCIMIHKIYNTVNHFIYISKREVKENDEDAPELFSCSSIQQQKLHLNLCKAVNISSMNLVSLTCIDLNNRRMSKISEKSKPHKMLIKSSQIIASNTTKVIISNGEAGDNSFAALNDLKSVNFYLKSGDTLMTAFIGLQDVSFSTIPLDSCLNALLILQLIM